MVILLMGVSGSGKTTVGCLLAQRLEYHFADADDWHSDANRQKMSQGIPLSDGDRQPWLQALHTSIENWISADENVVLACSALKQSYRDQLAGPQMSKHPSKVQWVYLTGDYELIRQRLRNRTDHFMSDALLKSQFEALEEPKDAIVVNIDHDVETIVSAIATHLESQVASQECESQAFESQE
ncbi:MAG: gluconokinase [Leptolyngbyaceae bacterium]|nr:gluconokinase [Leptolyngbyaceae bacterium]